VIEKIYKNAIAIVMMYKRGLKKNVLAKLVCKKKIIYKDSMDIIKESISLIKIVIKETIKYKKKIRPFWTSEYKELSKKLWLPTEYTVLNTDSRTILSTREMRSICPRNDIELYKSSLVDEWKEENIEKEMIKCRKIRIKLKDEETREKFEEWFNTARYVYNKTVHAIKEGEGINFMALRNELVTYEDINKVRNKNVKDWEIKVPSKIRATAVQDVCDAYTTSIANMRAGNIRSFEISYKKKTSFDQSIGIPKTAIKKHNGNLVIYSTRIKLGKRTKDIIVKKDCRLVKQKNRYYICIPYSDVSKVNSNDSYTRVVGVDPGVRKFMTTYSDGKSKEYRQNRDVLKRLNDRIDLLKQGRTRPLKEGMRAGYRKSSINKVEIRKENIINELHWRTISEIIKENDVVCFGDIKSHDIVKKSNNKYMKREIMDLKLYKFKQRLQMKCKEYNKRFISVNESYTSKTCTRCGILNDVGSSEKYKCKSCEMEIDRDCNGSRNILMKGVL
jgi:putative transposase